MANTLLTLLDLAKRRYADPAVGLVEEVITYAPELQNLMGRPIDGVLYHTTKRTGYAPVQFVKANDGSDAGKSTYEQIIGQCFLIDAQLQVMKALADSEAKGDAAALGDILYNEAKGVLENAFITVGKQFYYGLAADPLGFNGLQSQVDASMVIDATGTGGSTTSAYIVFEDVQGVHFTFGNNIGVSMMPDWRVQTVAGANGKNMTAYVNALTGWIGLAFNHKYACARIKNITSAKPLTDQLVAQALSKFPIKLRRNLKLFYNRDAEYYLRNSRSAVTGALTGSVPLAYAGRPTESNDIPAFVTDSLTTTEAAS